MGRLQEPGVRASCPLLCRSPSESSSESRSRSRSPTPGREEKITFITSFGGSDEEAAAAAAAAAASGAATGKPPAPPQPGGPAPGRNASARSVTLTLPALHPGRRGGDSGRRGATARAGADLPSVPHLQPPLLHLLLLLFRLEDLQLPLPLQLQLPLPPRRGLLPLWPPRTLPLPVLVALPLPLSALLEIPQPRPAALRWGLSRRTPLLPFACPAWRLRAPAQKQVRGAGVWGLGWAWAPFRRDQALGGETWDWWGGMCSLQVWCQGWSTASLLRDAVGRETELRLSREVPRCLQLATLRTGALRGQGPESQGSPLREGGA